MNGQMIINSSLVFLIFLMIGGILYTAVSTRQLNRRRKELEKLHQNLKIGAEIMFCGGLTGKISELDTDFIHVVIAEGAIIKISRYAVTQILP